MTRLAAAWRGAAVVGVLALAAGCGGDGTPERDAVTVRSEVMTQSAVVMDTAHVTGRQVGAFPPRSAPTDMSCDDDNDDSPDRVLSQMWTVHSKDNTAPWARAWPTWPRACPGKDGRSSGTARTPA
ncbi:hypothetical protein [Streptomyces sp. NBC_01198]|uniref:hypothetical protein n=1 Tax=Streptomyces sp. NBC_01198 TaxID=2903769 RepID=UPI002E0FAF57|nr:hypothetical protein OG702_06795 [Streptomyces sp. NBC_01198]